MVPKGEEREKCTENLFEEITTENFPKLEKETDINTQEAQRVSNKIPQRAPQKDTLSLKCQKLKIKRESFISMLISDIGL